MRPETIATCAAEYLERILSPRERETFISLGGGLTQVNIALSFGVSTKTVATFRRRALKKLNMRGNADVVRYCVKNSLV